jgi:indole-3-pyruvate monooxygenase
VCVFAAYNCHFMKSQSETLIIGAGPAGLAAAACLSKRGASFTIVDQATTIGSSWRRHYDRLHLHSDRDHSALPYLDFPEGTPRYPSRDQVIAYLERYAQHFRLAPHLGERVQSVRSGDAGWITTTTACVYCSKQVIVATGHNAVPHLPKWPGQEHFSGRIVHSSEYRNGEPFRGQSVLIIGLGNSGGEIAIDLLRHGARVAIAVRSPVNIVPREILGLPILTISVALSRLPARLADAFAAPLIRLTMGDISKLGFRRPQLGPITQIKTTSRVPLIDTGTVELVREGSIEVLGGVRSMGKTDVTFDDRSARRCDAIVLATGFRPDFDYFLGPHSPGTQQTHPGTKTTGEAGLYFCGFVVSPTGMLRDIGIEARRIAETITRPITQQPI